MAVGCRHLSNGAGCLGASPGTPLKTDSSRIPWVARTPLRTKAPNPLPNRTSAAGSCGGHRQELRGASTLARTPAFAPDAPSHHRKRQQGEIAGPGDFRRLDHLVEMTGPGIALVFVLSDSREEKVLSVVRRSRPVQLDVHTGNERGDLGSLVPPYLGSSRSDDGR